jgi:hypothetical protein
MSLPNFTRRDFVKALGLGATGLALQDGISLLQVVLK